MNNDDFLKQQCNRYTNGICTTLHCMLRGGYVRGPHKPEEVQACYDKATCEPHEILCELEKLRKLQ